MGRLHEQGRRRTTGVVVIATLLVAVGASGITTAAADGNEAPGAPLAYRSLAAGFNHACARLDSGQVKC